MIKKTPFVVVGLLLGMIFGVLVAHVLREDFVSRSSVYAGICVDVAYGNIQGRQMIAGHREAHIAFENNGAWFDELPIDCTMANTTVLIWVNKDEHIYQSFILVQDNSNMCGEMP